MFRKLFFNKRGEAYEMTQKVYFYIALVFFIGVLFVAFILLIGKNYDSKVSIEESVTADFTLSRITNTCFAHVDEITSETQQNVIDLSLVNSDELDDCFQAKRVPWFEIIVKPINKDDFESTRASMGKPSSKDLSFERYALVKTETGDLFPATIELKR